MKTIEDYERLLQLANEEADIYYRQLMLIAQQVLDNKFDRESISSACTAVKYNKEFIDIARNMLKIGEEKKHSKNFFHATIDRSFELRTCKTEEEAKDFYEYMKEKCFIDGYYYSNLYGDVANRSVCVHIRKNFYNSTLMEFVRQTASKYEEKF